MSAPGESRPPKSPKIPELTVRRLSFYLRALRELEEDGIATISSFDLARKYALNPAQVRKDLAYFGEFGVRGVGYSVYDLKAHLTRIMGLSKGWRVALFGLGNLGRALLAYKGFQRSGFQIIRIFEADSRFLTQQTYLDIPICPQMDAPEELRSQRIEIAIIAVPGEVAQHVADLIVEGGVSAILNFAPVRLKVPEGIKVRDVDFTIALESLAYFLNSD